MMRVQLLVSACAFLLHCFAVEAVVVELDLGELNGTEDVSRGGIKYFAFRGVPYAKPPLADLRFADPQSPDPWDEVLQATKFSAECPQGSAGNEDCLYLNVFTPQLNSTLMAPKLPVFVFFPGGAFVVGSTTMYGPDYFMDKPIVLVTVNYRLGALGFLHYDDEGLPGNYGLKDQNFALQWVQKYIHAFGGDPQQVTIGGQSAGGASVHWHMRSSLSKGLFHRAISQSGTMMAAWAEVPRETAKKRGAAFALLAGCLHNTVQENIKCLKNAPLHDILDAQAKMTSKQQNLLPFVIVPESVEESAWNSKNTSNVTWLVGCTSQEGGVFVSALMLPEFKKYFATLDLLAWFLLPRLLLINVYAPEKTSPQLALLSTRIKTFYFGWKPISEKTQKEMVDMLTDAEWIYDLTEAVHRHQGKMYLYVFDHEQENSFAILTNKNYTRTGPVHQDDLISLFKMTPGVPEPSNADDKRVSNLMIEMWTNFVMTGNPNSASLDFNWTPIPESKHLEYLNITTKPEMSSWYWEKPYSFWHGLDLHNESSWSPNP